MKNRGGENHASGRVILSAPLVLEEGTFAVRRVSLAQAKRWIRENRPTNYCGHQSVRLLGVNPSRARESCPGYTEAVALKVRRRLAFGREYSEDEITAADIDIFLITRTDTAGSETSTDVAGSDKAGRAR